MKDDSVERAIFYPILKGKTEQELHQIAFEQIAETTNLTNEIARQACEFLWINWQKPMALKEKLFQLYEIMGDIKWAWFDEWDAFFSEKGNYPHNWSEYRKKRKITTGEIKIALFYHSVHSRFSNLRRYENHYAILANCTWTKRKYNIKLGLIDDEIEADVIELLKPIKDNQLLILPPYFPAGRAWLMYDRIRD
ncbi:hypothetical protein A6B39_00530 [Mannheimia granulomatis]|uniref:hypothetical protein n=1 Tax=Mannheimia granulomatis TaxID=85402 RepID=UPI00159E5283|nr:hypothetical protein [Mannheimia granulomatis]QLB14038.1 hypothetical protein A6B39_00530 [Mannheimia granulomatis]